MYDKKGPFYCWKPKRAIEKEVKELNSEIEPFL